MTDDEILDWLLADLELPPEAAEHLRGTALYRRAVLAHRLHDLNEAIANDTPKWLQRALRAIGLRAVR